MLNGLHVLVAATYTTMVMVFSGLLAIVDRIVRIIIVGLRLENLIAPRLGRTLCLAYVFLASAHFVDPKDTLSKVVFYGLHGIAVTLYLFCTMNLQSMTFSHEGRLNAYERWFERNLFNPKDVYFLEILVVGSLATVPLFVLLFVPGYQNWAVFLMFFRLRFHAGPINEMLLHHNMHTDFFRTRHLKSRWTAFVFKAHQFYLDWIFGPMSSNHAHYYRVHHVYNHHKENNNLEDITTLAKYDRSSFFDFCKACLKFELSWTFGLDLLVYLLRNKKNKLAGMLVSGILWTAIFISVMYYLNPIGAYFFLFVSGFTGAGVALGVWSWHALVDPDDIGNIYTNCVNVDVYTYTMDAYHLEHHRKQAVHFSKYPELFVSQLEVYRREGSLIFRGLLSREMFVFCLLLKKFDVLATHLVNLESEPRNKKELAALLETRSKSIEPRQHSSFYFGLEKAIITLLWRLSGVPIKSPAVNYSKDEVEPWSAKLEPFFPGTENLRPFPLTQKYAMAMSTSAPNTSQLP